MLEFVTGKANIVLGIQRRNFAEYPKEMREFGYISTVRSIPEYASAV